MEQETWKPIQNYEGYYEISNFGRVKSLAKVWSVGKKNDTILKAGRRKNGYSFVVLCVDKKKIYASVHRLVAIHFCDNPNNFNIVNHLDSDTTNNCAYNLEWTTYSGNAIHGFVFGRRKGMKGIVNPNTKINEIDVLNIKELYKTGLSQNEIGFKYKLCQTQIGRIVRGDRWKHI